MAASGSLSLGDPCDEHCEISLLASLDRLHFFFFSRSQSLSRRNPRFIMATKQISKKRKFVADGVFYAELNELLIKELGEDGYAGVDLRVTPVKTEVIIRATRTQNVLGEKGARIRELTSVVQKRYVYLNPLERSCFFFIVTLPSRRRSVGVERPVSRERDDVGVQ